MKGKAIIPLALGLCIGLVAVKFGVDAIKKAQGSSQDKDTIKVVRTKLDLGMYQKIEKEMVELVEIPDSALIPMTERVGSLDGVVGRVTSKGIPMNSFVLQSMLAAQGTQAGMVGRIPDGFRAVSVKIDEVTGVAYQINPGDWVDVIVVMDVEKSRRERETIAEVILQNVQVAAIGQDSNAQTNAAGTGVKAKPAKSATLFVRQEDAPTLHLAQTRGKITLAMRGDDNATTNEKIVVRDSDAFSALKTKKPDVQKTPAVAQKPKTMPVKVQAEPEEPSPPHSVVVSRGQTLAKATAKPDVELITFENADSAKVITVSQGPASGSSNNVRSATQKARSNNTGRRQRPPVNETDDETKKPNDRYKSDGE